MRRFPGGSWHPTKRATLAAMRAPASLMLLTLVTLSTSGCEGVDPNAEEEKERGRVFVEAAAKENGAVQTASGLVYRTLTPGEGESPTASDRVTVHYTGRLIDGTTFDSSVNRGPATFPLSGVIRCWTEGVPRMRVGETALLVCPSDIAYGDRGRPPTIPGGATLQFEVELIAIAN